MKILIVGDVYSKLGRAALEENLKKIKEEQTINFIIINGENISHGKGMNHNHYKWLMNLGANVITMGNHTWNNRQIYDYIDDSNSIVRPLNYKGENVPGKGYVTVNYNGLKITVFQMIGRTFIDETNLCPFKTTEKLLQEVESDIYICDFHGEATSEKIAYGHYFDGKVDIIFGTHTHVQTSDLRIMPNGSAYITDVGMTGPLDGVIGTKKEIILNRFLNDAREVFEPQDTGRKQFCAIIVEISDITHKVTKVDRINVLE